MAFKSDAKHIWTALKQSGTDIGNYNITKLSAALAYYTVFALAPMLIVFTSILSFFFKRDAIEGRVYGQIIAKHKDKQTGTEGETKQKRTEEEAHRKGPTQQPGKQKESNSRGREKEADARKQIGHKRTTKKKKQTNKTKNSRRSRRQAQKQGSSRERRKEDTKNKTQGKHDSKTT